MKKWLVLILAALMALSVLSGCSGQADAPANTDAPASPDASADGSWERIQRKGYFIVGLDDSFPPMGYRDENDEIVGFDIDLAKAVAQELGIEVQFQPVVWDNIALEIANRNVDVIWNGCTITEERKQSFDFSEPYMLNEQVVVVLQDSPYQTLADLAGKEAGIQDGSSANIALDNNPEFRDSLSNVVGFADNDKALLDLAAGRLDCVIVDVTVFGHYIEKSPDTYRSLDETLGSEEFGIAFHQDDDAFRAKMQEALDALVANGTAKEISMKWFQRDVTEK